MGGLLDAAAVLSGPAKRGSNIMTDELLDEQSRRKRPAFENRKVQGAFGERGDHDGGEDEGRGPGDEAACAA